MEPLGLTTRPLTVRAWAWTDRSGTVLHPDQGSIEPLHPGSDPAQWVEVDTDPLDPNNTHGDASRSRGIK